MSTIEEFENAPFGSTATGPNGNIAFKTARREIEWVIYHPYENLRSDEMVGYTLNPAAPTTAREAFDLTWELAHEVKEGQVIPEGMRYVRRYQSGDLATFISNESWTPRYKDKVRTQDPIPDPEPEWTKAPAVLATMECSWQKVWLPRSGGKWVCTCCGAILHWSALAEVTPLYPKETN